MLERIRPRFGLGIRNLFHIYRPLLETWKLYDNTKRNPRLIAEETYGPLTGNDLRRMAETGKLKPR